MGSNVPSYNSFVLFASFVVKTRLSSIYEPFMQA